MIPIGPRYVIPDRAELGLRARAVLLHGLEHRLRLGPIPRRLGFQVLRLAGQIAETRALDGERRLKWKARPVVADQTVGAFPQRVVREVGFPLDDGRLIA